MSHHPPINARKWHRRLKGWLDASGQALVEYVLILVLIIMALAVILSITGPAVGNVFSNTVANLLNLTTTPEDPMSEGDFWLLVTAVASYTPDSSVLITNTPLPDGDFDGDGIPNTTDNCPAVPNPDQLDVNPANGVGDLCDPDSDDNITDADGDGFYDNTCSLPYPTDPQQRKKCDNCFGVSNNDQADADGDGQGDACEPPPPTATFTPGPSPTPQDQDFPYPFTDNGNKDNFEHDFDTSLKGEWDADYWKRNTAGCRDSDNYGMGTTPIAEEKVTELVFPRSTHYWSGTGSSAHPNIGSSDFCARYTQTAYISAGNYKWRIRIDPTGSDSGTTPLQGDRVQILVNGTNIYNDWDGLSNIFYGPNSYAFNATNFTTEVTESSQASANYNGNFVEFNWTAPTTADYNFEVRYADRTGAARLEVYMAESDFIDQGTCNWTNVTQDSNGSTNITPPPGVTAFWTDSPNDTNYAHDSFCILRLRGTIDLAGSNFPFVEWYDVHDINDPPDTFWLGVKRTSDTEWFLKPIHSTKSTSWSWTRREVSLSTFQGYYENTGRAADGTRQAAPEQDFTDSTVEVAFIVESDSSNNREGWMVGRFRTFEKVLPSYSFPFLDDFEGTQKWVDTSGGPWGLTTDAYSGSNAWDDRPGSSYQTNRDYWFELNGLLDMTNTGSIVQPELAFWHKWDLASGTKVQVEISRDFGENWQALRTSPTDSDDALYTGSDSNPTWKQENIPLDITTIDGKDQNLIGERFMVRFRIITGSNTATGWTIDDVAFRNKPVLSTIFPNWCDEFNSIDSLPYWVMEGSWSLGAASIGQGSYTSPTVLTDSPSANYAHGSDTSARLDRIINLSGATTPIVEFWHRWDIAAAEWLRLEMYQAITDSWDPIWSYYYNQAPMLYDASVTSGNDWSEQYAWQRVVVPLNGLLDAGNTDKEIQLRWRLDATTTSSVSDGWYIDNVCIREYDDPLISVPWSDDFESDATNWYRAEWNTATPTNPATARAGSKVMEDLPAVNYLQPSDTILELRGLIDLTSGGLTTPTLYYWENYQIGLYDRTFVEVLQTNLTGVPSGTWKPIATVLSSRQNEGWNRRQVDLTPYLGQYIRLRFRVIALRDTSSDAGRGWAIDELRLVDRADIETTITSLPFRETADLGATRWVREGDWSLVTDSRPLGSGSVLGPGQWDVEYYRRPGSFPSFPPPVGTSGYEFIVGESVAEIDFNWGSSAPALILDNDAGRNDNWVGIYTRRVVFSTATTMNIQIRSDDGHVLRIDGLIQPNTGQWINCGDCSTNINYNFSAGTHDLEIFHTESTSGAKLSVSFTPVSGGIPQAEYDPFGGVSWQATYYKYCDEANITGSPWNSTPETVPAIDFDWTTDAVSPIVLANNTAGTPQPGGPGGPPFTAVSGTINIPAERPHANISALGRNWGIVNYPWPAFGGNAMEAQWDSGTNTSDANTGPELQYEVNFPAAGTWYMWVRGSSYSTSSDSIHVGLNNDGPISYGGTGISVNNNGSWGWASTKPSNPTYPTTRIQFNVPSAGVHTIKVWMREDGVYLDHLFLSQNSSATPPATDPTPAFSCDTGNPKEFWAAKYERTVVVPESTTVTFSITSNDRHRLFVAPNGGAYNQIANKWSNGNQSSITTYIFPPGSHKVKIEYAQRFLSDGADLTLSYVVDGAVFHSDNSKGGDYPENYSASLMLENEIDLTSLASAGLSWWDRYGVSTNDFLVVEVNTVGGNDPLAIGGASTWQRVYERPGSHSVTEWRQRFVDLTPYVGQKIVVRFRLEALNTNGEDDGWYIDDIEIND